jgi:hypothetical protein
MVHCPLLCPGRFFSFVILYTFNRTPWMGDQPIHWSHNSTVITTIRAAIYCTLFSLYSTMEKCVLHLSLTIFLICSYEWESVNRIQMDIIRKTHNIQIWEKHLSLKISFTNIDTLVPLLYQCIESHSTEVFWLLFQSLLHLLFNLFILSSETFETKMAL